MANTYFSFKEFTIYQDKSAFKVGTDGVLLGASADVRGARRILDIGCGTGLVAIMIAQRCDAHVFAIEPDQDSFLQASDNASLTRWNSRIRIEHTSLQLYYPEVDKFDLIVTNPPYYVNSLKSPDQRKSSARHDVSISHEELLKGVSRLLDSEGRFQLIMPYAEGNIFIAEAARYGFFCNNILKIKPLPTADIRRLILTFGREKSKTTERFLTVEHGGRHEFTDEYISLTKDFYLKF